MKAHLFQFSFKLLLAVLTLAAIWIGWNTSIVNNRKRLLRSLDQNTAVIRQQSLDDFKAAGYRLNNVTRHELDVLGAFNQRRYTLYKLRSPKSGDLSYIRRLLGDEPFHVIELDKDSDREEYLSAFPEAQIFAPFRY